MAKINNSAVIQKLINELELSPAKDLIPTELAEKILPVFQVNSQEMIVRPPVANIVKQNTATGATPATIYTTPATGKFFLTNIHLDCYTGSEIMTGNEHGFISIVIDGTTVKILSVGLKQIATGALDYSGQTATFNLQNPILIDPATDIVINNSSANISGVGSIVGYTDLD